MDSKDVLAIVICFYPDHQKLIRLIEAIGFGGGGVIVFDNGGLDRDALVDVSSKVRIFSLGRNVGLGEALNYGCDEGVRAGYRFIVSFDQDSSPSPEMISVLKRELLAYQAWDPRAIAIGPQLLDCRNGKNHVMPFIRFKGLKAERWSGGGTQPVSHLITSGCLIDLGCWGAVDRFLGDLFIDYVDNNWSWRTGRRGYVLLGTSLAAMPHEISEGVEKKGFFSLNKYSPFRRYFQVRNSVYHILYERLTFAQRLYVLRGLAVVMASSLASDASRHQSVWQCVRGLGHGLIGRLGPCRD